MPVYNVEPYLEECFASILSQALEGVEVIAVDDRSTDNSSSILNNLKASAGVDIKLLQHVCNQGVAPARNTLLGAATGDYLWVIDPDETLSQGAASCLKNIIASHSPDLIMCDYKRWRPEADSQSARERINWPPLTVPQVFFMMIRNYFSRESMKREEFIHGQKFQSEVCGIRSCVSL